jgi:hypothetical protein
MDSMAFTSASRSNLTVDESQISFGSIDFQPHPPTLIPIFGNLGSSPHSPSSAHAGCCLSFPSHHCLSFASHRCRSHCRYNSCLGGTNPRRGSVCVRIQKAPLLIATTNPRGGAISTTHQLRT